MDFNEKHDAMDKIRELVATNLVYNGNNEGYRDQLRAWVKALQEVAIEVDMAVYSASTFVFPS